MDELFLRSCGERLSERLMHVSCEYDFSQSVLALENVQVLSALSMSEREAFSRAFGVMVLYLGDEVQRVKEAEELAVMSAFPAGFRAEELNVLNVGCGDRVIRPDFICLDGFRSSSGDQASGRHASAFSGSILSTIGNLPFRNSSVDVVLSLHSLEHVDRPIEVLKSWIQLLKPGGGIGLILPDYRYTYSARGDASLFGHKWDPSPDLIQSWYEKYLKDIVILEQLDTLDACLSFDVVLRKPGEFRSFAELSSSVDMKSGRSLDENGVFPNDIY